MDKKQAILFAHDTLTTTIPQLLETLHNCNISTGQYNQISLYNEILSRALITSGMTEARLNIYETSVISLVNGKYLQIRG